MEETKHVKIEVADPTPLGLMGLAMVTFVASTQKFGMTEGLSFIIPWAIFLGAIAQIMASMLDYKHNNLFGATAFAGYGFFWLAVASSWMIKMGVLGPELAASFDGKQLGVAFLGYFIFSLIITVGAFRLNTMLSVLMLVIDVLVLALAMDSLGMGHGWHTVAAYSEMITALISFYGVAANFINKSYGRTLLPVGKAWCK